MAISLPANPAAQISEHWRVDGRFVVGADRPRIREDYEPPTDPVLTGFYFLNYLILACLVALGVCAAWMI